MDVTSVTKVNKEKKYTLDPDDNNEDSAEIVSKWENVNPDHAAAPQEVKHTIDKELADNVIHRFLRKWANYHRAPDPAQKVDQLLKVEKSVERLSMMQLFEEHHDAKIESDIEKLLSGCGWIDDGKTVDLEYPHSSDFHPNIKKNVCFIVCAVVFDKDGNVLVTQDAKLANKGKWYIPYGRVLPNETLKSSMQVIFKRETGLDFEVTSLLTAEFQGVLWYRFTFTGIVKGGTLKTQADDYSMKAEWKNVNELMFEDSELRCRDCLTLIICGMEQLKLEKIDRVLPTLPVTCPYSCMLLRYILLCIDNDKQINILTNTDDIHHLPLAKVCPNQTATCTIVDDLNQTIFGTCIDAKRVGLMRVEFQARDPGDTDGLCVSLIYIMDSHTPAPTQGTYTWHAIEDVPLKYKLLSCLKRKKFVSVQR